ncbi:terminase small subunit [Candidatus Pacearchaeota archaeon]|nr:terminase small subunit [Candidatus Pacearchaeota archaeon]
MKRLTIKQEKFAVSVASGEFDYEWMSYEKCYNVRKLSKNNVYVETARLLQNPKISHRVKEIRDRAAKKSEMTLVKVLDKLASYLNFNIKSIIKEDGSLKKFHEMTDEEASSIQDFQIEEIWQGRGKNREVIGELKRVKLIDKRATADMFMKKFGAYVTKFKFDPEDLTHMEEMIKMIKTVD